MKDLQKLHAEIAQGIGAAQARRAFLVTLAKDMRGGDATHNLAFASEKNFAETLDEVEAVDMRYGAFGIARGLFTAADYTPARLAEVFTEICVRQWSADHRPSLPAVAEGILEIIGIDRAAVDGGLGLSAEEQSLARAVMLTALRAEYIRGQAPARDVRTQANVYHNTLHTIYVALITSYLVQVHQGLANKGQGGALTRADQLTAILFALGHDIDHPGKGNPKDQPLANEHAAFDAMRPILYGCNVPRARVRQGLAMLRTTSPNGPHAYLKDVAKAMRDPQSVGAIDAEGKFTDLDALLTDAKLTELAAILSDADLYASTGAGLEANKAMSLRITREAKESGLDMDFTGDAARAYFLDHVVGEDGFASAAGRASFNQFFADLKNYTEMRLKMAKGEIRPDL